MQLEKGLIKYEAKQEDYIQFDDQLKRKERQLEQSLREKASEKNLRYEILKERLEKKKKMKTFKMTLETALVFQ